jgi:hypothetical protein
VGEVLTSTVCPVCGARYLENIKACPNCGAVPKSNEGPLLFGKAVTWVDSFPMELEHCPKCGGHNIRRIRQIVKDRSADPELRFRVKAPARPALHTFWLYFVPTAVALGSGLILFAFTVVLSAYYLAPEKDMRLPDWDIVLCFWMGAFGFIVGLLVTRKVAEVRRNRLRELGLSLIDHWIAEMEVWERLYYCADCDLLHDPLVRRSAHVYSLQNLLEK